jgi:hypothetical protein
MMLMLLPPLPPPPPLPLTGRHASARRILPDGTHEDWNANELQQH